MYVLVWFVILCFLCDIPGVSVVFGTSVFHFKEEMGDDRFNLVAKHTLVLKPRGNCVESSCSIGLTTGVTLPKGTSTG